MLTEVSKIIVSDDSRGIYAWKHASQAWHLYKDADCSIEFTEQEYADLCDGNNDDYWDIVAELTEDVYTTHQGVIYRLYQDGGVYGVDVEAEWCDILEDYYNIEDVESMQKLIDSQISAIDSQDYLDHFWQFVPDHLTYCSQNVEETLIKMGYGKYIELILDNYMDTVHLELSVGYSTLPGSLAGIGPLGEEYHQLDDTLDDTLVEFFDYHCTDAVFDNEGFYIDMNDASIDIMLDEEAVLKLIADNCRSTG